MLFDAGKFKGAQIANNQFTTSLDVGATIEANALIPYDSEFSRDETKLGYIYLDSNIADPLVRSISAMFLQRIGELTESYNPKEQLDLVMDDFTWLYGTTGIQGPTGITKPCWDCTGQHGSQGMACHVLIGLQEAAGIARYYQRYKAQNNI